MKALNTRQLDLNLLVVFTTLWDSRNVTRASERLSLTQPAVSHALRRLRERLDDPLFVNGRDGLLPTPRAVELIGPVREALAKIDMALQVGPSFVPATDRREFRIAAGDFVEFALLPQLIERVSREAPGIALKLAPFPETTSLQPMLMQGAIDLAIGVLPLPRLDLCSERLTEYQGCALIWKREGLLPGRFPLPLYLERPHVVLDTGAHGGSFFDVMLSKQGHRRRIGAQVQNILTMPVVAAHTGYVCSVPRQIGDAFADVLGLTCHDLPFDLGAGKVTAYWHERFNADPGLTWLRKQVQLSAADEGLLRFSVS